jgi:Co/Zn/Cd efflux system component
MRSDVKFIAFAFDPGDANHSVAIPVTALSYRFARCHATDPRYSFGTGKGGELAGYLKRL